MTETSVSVRPMTAADRDVWARMRCALWDFETHEQHLAGADQILSDPHAWGFITEANGAAVGFAEVAVRKYANGCEQTPVPFLEGIWIAPEHRRKGAGETLIAHVSAFLREHGFTELCSDALLENTASHAAHGGWGFAETERVVYFRKAL